MGSRITRAWVAVALVLGTAGLLAPLARAHGRPHRHGHPFSFGFAYGYPGWVAAYPPPYVGWVDLDIVPEEAEVYVGRALAGTTDDFDGFPDLLALRPGTRLITLRHPGYEDMRLRLRISPGVRIRIQRRMIESASGRR